MTESPPETDHERKPVPAENSVRVATTGLACYVGWGVGSYSLPGRSTSAAIRHPRTASKLWGGRWVDLPVGALSRLLLEVRPRVLRLGSFPIALSLFLGRQLVEDAVDEPFGLVGPALTNEPLDLLVQDFHFPL